MTKPFTGRRMAAVMVGGFGIVIAVNMTAAVLASSTFGGIVVENSYVASQKYNGWLQQAEAQRQLGWTISAARLPDGRIELTTAGVPTDAQVNAIARHPLGRMPDMPLVFAADADGRFSSSGPLAAGRWILRVTVAAQGQTFREEIDLS